jgi:HK97 family phage portal protein
MYAYAVGMGSWLASHLRRSSAPRNDVFSVSDPSLGRIFQIGPPNFSGVDVGESTAMSLSAVYRAVSLISGTCGTLPMRTLRDTGDGMRQRMSSVFDDPGGPDGPTPMNWTETTVAHLVLHGNAYLRKIYGGAGQLIALEHIHPMCVTPRWPRPGEDDYEIRKKHFWVTLLDGRTMDMTSDDLVHVMGLSLDGVAGMSCITMARNGLGTALAGDRAAAKMFSSGALIAGMVSSEDEVDEDEATVIKASLDRSANGWENAGTIPFINRKLKFTPWTMSAADAQFLESRAFQIEEIARWFGVPPHLLMQTDKQTSWGTGVEEQNNGLARFTLNHWTTRIEQALSRLLPGPRWVEFDYAGLERPTPEDEIALLISQVQAGLLTVDEARAIRNMPPLNVPAIAADPAEVPEPEVVPA